MTESEIQSAIHRKLGSRPDVRLFRNHVGKVRDERGRWHAFGLAPGSADLIGWHSVTVTPDMVGQQVAVFLSVEVKTATGRVREDQEAWARIVKHHGGKAIIARSTEIEL